VFVGNVDYDATPEELMELFRSAGTINQARRGRGGRI